MKKLFLILISILLSHNLHADKFFPWLYNAIILINNANLSEYHMPIDMSLDNFEAALDQKAAPIIASSNIVHAFFWRRKVWAENRKNPDSLEQITEDYVDKWKRVVIDLKNKNATSGSTDLLNDASNKLREAWYDFEEEQARILNIDQVNRQLFYALLGDYFTKEIVFNESEWNIYRSRAEDWYVFIPQSYLETARQAWNGQRLVEALQVYKNTVQASWEQSINQAEKAALRNELQMLENQLGLLSDAKKLDAYLLGLNIHLNTVLIPTNLAQLRYKILDKNMIKRGIVNVDNLLKLFITKDEYAFGNWIIALSGDGLASLGGYENELKKLNKTITDIKNAENYIAKIQGAGPLEKKDLEAINKTITIAGGIILPEGSRKEAARNYLDTFRKETEAKIDTLLKTPIENLKLKKELDPDAYIASLPIKGFVRFLDFLNDKVFTQFLFYTTCFGGGYNLIQPFKKFFSTLIETFDEGSKKLIQSKQLNFTIAAASTTDDIVAQYSSQGLMTSAIYKFWKIVEALPANWSYFHHENSPIELLPATIDYHNFFGQSDRYFTNPGKTTSLEKILTFGDINLNLIGYPDITYISSIPSVLFPGTSFFQAPAIDVSIQRLTYALVTARTLEKKTLVLDRSVALIYPSEIHVPIQLRVNKNYVSPRLISMAQGPGIYYIQELDASSSSLDEVLKESFFVFRYQSPKLFFIKKLITEHGTYESVLIQVQETDNVFIGTFNNNFYMQEWNDLSHIELGQETKNISAHEAHDVGTSIIDEWRTIAKGYSFAVAPWLIDNDLLAKKIKEEFLSQFTINPLSQPLNSLSKALADLAEKLTLIK